ncbi:Rrna-processing protein [Globisporangium polare]
MRYLRAKGIRKALRQFHFLCGIKPPYKLLLDGNFIAMCMQMKVDIHERLPKFLQVKPHEVQYFIPAAALKELELLGDAMRPAFEVAQSFTVVEDDVPVASADSAAPVDVTAVIRNIIGERNDRKFLVATQEVELRKELRAIPGVPLFYLNRSVLVFEDISRATLAIVRQEEKVNRAKLDVNEKRKLEHVAADDKNKDEDEEERRRLKKVRAKGPNPLSMKKPLKKKVRAKKTKKE